MATDLKTFAGWIAEGRSIRAGQKAAFYLVSPDGQYSRALFAEDQTEEHNDLEVTKDWSAIVPADQRPQRNSKRASGDTRAAIRVDYETEKQLVKVWAGPNQRAIKQLQKGGYRYAAITHRWSAIRPDIQKVVAGLESSETRVILTIDGEKV